MSSWAHTLRVFPLKEMKQELWLRFVDTKLVAFSFGLCFSWLSFLFKQISLNHTTQNVNNAFDNITLAWLVTWLDRHPLQRARALAVFPVYVFVTWKVDPWNVPRMTCLSHCQLLGLNSLFAFPFYIYLPTNMKTVYLLQAIHLWAILKNIYHSLFLVTSWNPVHCHQWSILSKRTGLSVLLNMFRHEQSSVKMWHLLAQWCGCASLFCICVDKV